MTFNKQQNIGNVLFIVEGAKSEFALLKHIFTRILNYSLILNKRHHDNFEQYKSSENKFSTIAVINTKESNIKFAGEGGDQYLDQIYETLINDYDFDVDNASIFYLFDRDHHSNNNPKFIEILISKLKNPLDNNEYKAGELLLSYPGIETYKLSFTKNNIHLINDSLDNKIIYCNQLKTFVDTEGLGNIQKVNHENLLNACEEFFTYLSYINSNFDINNDLDDFSPKSLKIFNIQENNLHTKGHYDFFSMLSLAFLQLGIIQL